MMIKICIDLTGSYPSTSLWRASQKPVRSGIAGLEKLMATYQEIDFKNQHLSMPGEKSMLEREIEAMDRYWFFFDTLRNPSQ